MYIRLFTRRKHVKLSALSIRNIAKPRDNLKINTVCIHVLTEPNPSIQFTVGKFSRDNKQTKRDLKGRYNKIL